MAAVTDLAPLLARVALRDRRAFEQLYRATCSHLLGIALRIVHDRERAQDVLQEAYVSIWHGAAGYNAALGRPMTWLINIVRHRAIDLRRSRRAEDEATEPLDEDEAAEPGGVTPERLLQGRLQRLHIDACMVELPAAQRQALALAYYRGMAHSEIAGVLNAPLGTAKVWVRRALDRLRDCLERAGFDAGL